MKITKKSKMTRLHIEILEAKMIEERADIKTRFSATRRPPRWHPVGTYRVDHNGNLQVKVEDKNKSWVPVKNLVWEKNNGPIQDGHVVIFKTGLKTNILEDITLDKLECLERSAALQKHRINDSDYVKIKQLYAEIKKNVKRIEKMEEEGGKA